MQDALGIFFRLSADIPPVPLPRRGHLDAAALEAKSSTRKDAVSPEREHASFSPAQLAGLRASGAAWRFFSAQPPWYRRTVTHWVVSGKRPETRARRMATLIADCTAGRRIKQLARP